MSKLLDELGGKCPYMPFLDRGQMSEGEHVRPPLNRCNDKQGACFLLTPNIPSQIPVVSGT